MNQGHEDTDSIVELGNAANWTLEPVDHLAGCEDCRSAFRELAAVRHALDGTEALPGPVVDTLVREAQTATPTIGESQRGAYDWAARLLTPLLATAAAVLVVLMSG